MAGLNTWTGIGNLGRDAEMRATRDGTAVASFSLAVTEKYKDKETTLWVRCSLFGKPAEALTQYLEKGKQVCVVGPLSLNEYTNRDGEQKTSLECKVDKLTLLSSGGGRSERSAPRDNYDDGPGEGHAGGSAPPNDDDIPF